MSKRLRRRRPRTAGPIVRCALLLASLSIVAGCSTAPPVADARPRDLPRSALASAVWLGSIATELSLRPGAAEETTRIVRVERLRQGSGILLGDDLLLTNAHVWAEDGALPARRTILLGRPALAGPPVEHVFELVASSPIPDHMLEKRADKKAEKKADENDEEGAKEERRRAGDGPVPDWTLARCLDATWTWGEAARIHPPAADPAWRPAAGSELLVAGHAPMFIRAAADGDDAPEPSSALEAAERFASAGPFVIRGPAVAFGDHAVLAYPATWPSPTGQSGGPVFVRDPDDGRLFLIGVFHARISLGSADEEGPRPSLLAFDPIGVVLEASGLELDALRNPVQAR